MQPLSRSGRRVWDLSFSYLQDSDMFSATEQLPKATGWTPIFDTDGYLEGTHWHTNNVEERFFGQDLNLLESNNFYSQVIHKTNGGQLPFIFQPDKDNNNPDQFAIAKLDMNSFQFEQVAKNIYNIKLKIREVW